MIVDLVTPIGFRSAVVIISGNTFSHILSRAPVSGRYIDQGPRENNTW